MAAHAEQAGTPRRRNHGPGRVAAQHNDDQHEQPGKRSIPHNTKHSPVWHLLDQALGDWGTTCRSIALILGTLLPVLITLVLVHGSLATIAPWLAGIGTMLGMCRYANNRSNKKAGPPPDQPP